jgi:hypothetical protein
MSEENLIQQLFNQIDRLVAMQNTTLSVVVALFAIIIGVFAFFQWRINQKDQDVIIKTAKEEVIEILIKNYNLLHINENRDKLINLMNQVNGNYKEQLERIHDLEKESITVSYNLESFDLTVQQYLLIQEYILKRLNNNEFENEDRDHVIDMIKGFIRNKQYKDLRKGMASNLFQLLMLHSKEKIDKEDFNEMLEENYHLKDKNKTSQ